ncbi:hypothetical protein PAECIP111891_00509 [Paenibacillus allorhizoplanae]|uniref:Solute-binding protein family 3/N-terminal domain-containing protein n=1 Tax=Paenibacillus allorhizoplanae TaxID=2905648 RepID=A0ABM9BRW6_9BACL|nr:aliphatic sulfonate ABC transporter substrate-binding protein [Paenibacillus allorhizoplanae]CAH1193214.1 hypothetical protein PAECIP111891_00509 [Paenibacillus allorhizoplanae]
MRKRLSLFKGKSVAFTSIVLSAMLAISACGSNGTPAGNAQKPSPATSGSAKKQEVSEIRVGYLPDLNGSPPIVLGEEKGFFKEEGVKVTPVKFLSGPPEFQAMAAGDLDIAYIGAGATFLAAQGKGTILMPMSFSLSDMVLATKKSGVTDWKDLKGKTIGVPKGTSGEMILNLGLEKGGLKASDINIVNMDVAGAITSFVANKVDAVAIWSPYTAEIEKQVGKDNIIKLGDNKTFYPDYVFPASWVVSPKFLKEKPEAVEKFLKAWIKANDYKLQNVEETIKLTAAYTQVPEASLREQRKGIEWMESKKIAEALQDGSANKWYENLEKLFVATEKMTEIVPADKFIAPQPFLNASK